MTNLNLRFVYHLSQELVSLCFTHSLNACFNHSGKNAARNKQIHPAKRSKTPMPMFEQKKSLEIIKLLTTLCLIFFGQHIQAEKLYQVELYIFEQPQRGSTELWPNQTSSDFINTTEQMIRIQPLNELETLQFQQIPQSWVQSADILTRLKRSSTYRLLYQGAWQQPFEAKSTATPIYISAGNFTGNQPELEGSIRLHKGRYLHIEAHLVLGQYQLGAQQPIDSTPTENLSTNLPPLPLDDEIPVQALEVYELKESRRMRSGELHYLDHPRLGVLIQVHRVDT